MPLKADVSKQFPELESLSSRDRQRLIIWASNLTDTLETISRRAQEAGLLAEQVQAQQKTLINNLASPSITNSQDASLGSIGNLTADLKAVTVGATPVTGKVAVKDNN